MFSMPALFSDHFVCVTSISIPISVLSEGRATGSYRAFAYAIVPETLLPPAKSLRGDERLLLFQKWESSEKCFSTFIFRG